MEASAEASWMRPEEKFPWKLPEVSMEALVEACMEASMDFHEKNK